MAKVRQLPTVVDPMFWNTRGHDLRTRPSTEFIDDLLDRAVGRWTYMPDDEAEVNAAPVGERYELVADLPTVFSEPPRLNYWHQQGYMTEQQEEKWDKVLELMERNYASFEYLDKIATGEAE